MYDIEIISKGCCVDRDTTPKYNYLIETVTFRVLDDQAMRDYLLARHQRFEDCVDTYDVTPEEYDQLEKARAELRAEWERHVLSKIFHRALNSDFCEAWTITHVMNEIFTAIRIKHFPPDCDLVTPTLEPFGYEVEN